MSSTRVGVPPAPGEVLQRWLTPNAGGSGFNYKSCANGVYTDTKDYQNRGE
jgi:hypothetical protein